MDPSGLLINDQNGLIQLASWMKELGEVHAQTEIVFGIEPIHSRCSLESNALGASS